MFVRFSIYILLAIAAPALAQPSSPLHMAFSHQGASWGVFADYQLNSNAITHALAYRFYKGEFIDTPLKDATYFRLLRENRMGADGNYGMYYVHLPDSLWGKRNFGLFFSLRDRNHLDTRFSDDFYTLLFYGNSRFEEKTANLSGFNLNLLRYQQLQFGVIWAGLDSLGKLGASLSVLNGNYNYFFNAGRAELFTGKEGHYIDLNTTFQARTSDSGNVSYFAHNGYGFSSELFFEAPFTTKRLKGKLHITLSDIGFIRWNDKSRVAAVDSSYHYEGIRVKSIFDLRDSAFTSLDEDSIRTRLIAFNKKLFTSIIPATLNISMVTHYGKVNFTKGFRYIFNAGYKPYYYLGGEYRVNDAFTMALNLGYGGYGTFNLGIGFLVQAGKQFAIQAGASNVEAYLLPRSTLGQGVFINLQKRF